LLPTFSKSRGGPIIGPNTKLILEKELAFHSFTIFGSRAFFKNILEKESRDTRKSYQNLEK